ncbi:MAG: hypothetical protein AVDCRST_MAG66-2519, partial [uncultured Pseudonocardia sp.]
EHDVVAVPEALEQRRRRSRRSGHLDGRRGHRRWTRARHGLV